jgi:hypothetical protein
VTGHRPPCGTYNGYSAHIRRSEIPCDPCREAHRVWVENYRVDNPDSTARNAARTSARSRAMERLARAHEDAFEALFAEELEAAGVA